MLENTDKIFFNLKEKDVLIHNITNYVTVNSCANILLAVKASPIMSDEIEEVEEITAICGGLNINIGTLNSATIKSMFKAGVRANELGKIVVLDPVGTGASKLRTKTTNKLINEVKFDVIKGNISEIKTIALGENKTKGVDANISDKISEDNIDETVNFVKELSNKLDCIIVVTGAIDIVANCDKAYIIKNGDEMMGKITGTGCMLSSVICAYVVANKESDLLDVVANAVCCMGIAGEIAKNRIGNQDGNASYSNYLVDAMFNMTSDLVKSGASYEIR